MDDIYVVIVILLLSDDYIWLGKVGLFCLDIWLLENGRVKLFFWEVNDENMVLGSKWCVVIFVMYVLLFDWLLFE